MDLEDEIRYLITHYPDLFPSRSHALNQMFCVIGNGYEWEDGELVRSVAQDKTEPFDPIKDFMEMLESDRRNYGDSDPAFRRHLVRRAQAHLQKLREQLHFADDRCKVGFPCKWYELSEYSRATLVPDDVKPEWLAATREALERLMFDLMIVTRDKADNKNYRRARKELEKLDKRFGPDGVVAEGHTHRP